MIYAMSNSNIFELGYTEEQILKFWGEIFYWAVLVLNFGPSHCDIKRTRWEVFNGTAPNMQTIRLLPIFSILLVQTGLVYEYGLYLGPQYTNPQIGVTPGGIRVSTLSQKGVITVIHLVIINV